MFDRRATLLNHTSTSITLGNSDVIDVFDITAKNVGPPARKSSFLCVIVKVHGIEFPMRTLLWPKLLDSFLLFISSSLKDIFPVFVMMKTRRISVKEKTLEHLYFVQPPFPLQGCSESFSVALSFLYQYIYPLFPSYSFIIYFGLDIAFNRACWRWIKFRWISFSPLVLPKQKFPAQPAGSHAAELTTYNLLESIGASAGLLRPWRCVEWSGNSERGASGGMLRGGRKDSE